MLQEESKGLGNPNRAAFNHSVGCNCWSLASHHHMRSHPKLHGTGAASCLTWPTWGMKGDKTENKSAEACSRTRAEALEAPHKEAAVSVTTTSQGHH